MKKYFTVAKVLLFTLGLSGTVIQAQVGMVGNHPDRSAALDLKANNPNRGLLIPNVSLASMTDKASIVGGAPAHSLLVYNISGTGQGQGYYYWDNVKGTWIKLATLPDIPAGTKATMESPNGTITVTGTNNVLSATSVDIKPGTAAQVLTTNDAGKVVWGAQNEMSGGLISMIQKNIGGGNKDYALGAETEITNSSDDIVVTVTKPSRVLISGRMVMSLSDNYAAGAGYVKIGLKGAGVAIDNTSGFVPYSVTAPVRTSVSGQEYKNFTVVNFETSVYITTPGTYRYGIFIRPLWTAPTGASPLSNTSHLINPYLAIDNFAGNPGSFCRVAIYNQ